MSADPAPGLFVEKTEEEYALSLPDILRAIRRRLLVIVLTVAVCVAAAIGISFALTPQYEATIKILVDQKQENEQSGSPGRNFQGLEKLTVTMADLVNSRTVTDAVIEELDLGIDSETFLEHMSVEQVPNTQVIEVSYRDPVPEDARRIVATIGDVFSNQVTETGSGANDISATVWEQAATPDEPVSPDLLLNTLLALMLGLGIGMGLAFLLEYLDDSWHSPEEAEQITGVPTFGMVRQFGVPQDKKSSTS
jgi:capsular polysaccharide biosynthesis protein